MTNLESSKYIQKTGKRHDPIDLDFGPNYIIYQDRCRVWEIGLSESNFGDPIFQAKWLINIIYRRFFIINF